MSERAGSNGDHEAPEVSSPIPFKPLLALPKERPSAAIPSISQEFWNLAFKISVFKVWFTTCESRKTFMWKCSQTLATSGVNPYLGLNCLEGFPGGSASKESICNAGDWVQSLRWEDPLEKGTATHSSILAWRIPWTIYSPRGGKGLDTTKWLSLHFNCLEQFISKCTKNI